MLGLPFWRDHPGGCLPRTARPSGMTTGGFIESVLLPRILADETQSKGGVAFAHGSHSLSPPAGGNPGKDVRVRRSRRRVDSANEQNAIS